MRMHATREIRAAHHGCALLLATVLLLLAGPRRAPADGPAPHPPNAATSSHSGHDATIRHSFEDVQHWVSVFDDPARDAWQKPREVVHALGLAAGMCVADIGAGTGYFSRYLSEAVGETGTVLAAEPESKLVVHLRERAEQEHTANLVPILASLDNPRLPASAVDLILIVDTLHHIDDRVNYLRRLRRFLKPTGRIAIVDFKKQEAPVGPPVEHKLAREQVVGEMQSAGYQLATAPDLLPYQYVLIFRPH